MISEIRIPGTDKTIGGKDVFIIAEIGKNFIITEQEQPVWQYLENAKVLIDEAAKAGVDAVKFQTHELEDEWHPHIVLASPHFKTKDRFSWIKRNTEATPLNFWKEISDYAKSKNLVFFSTPMSKKAAEKINHLVPIWKLASGDVTDHLLIDYMIETGKPIIISNGQMSLAELDMLVKRIESKRSQLAMLYCVSKYPCPEDMFNLGTIEYLKEKYPHITIGFSDHSIDSNYPALAAVKMGAKIVEKHFSMSRDLWGADHKASLTPSEMKQLVDDVRKGVFKYIDERNFYGEKTKELDGANNEFRPYFGKVLVAGKDIQEGTIVTSSMLYAMRPAIALKGIPGDQLHNVVGKKVKKKILHLQALIFEDIL